MNGFRSAEFANDIEVASQLSIVRLISHKFLSKWRFYKNNITIIIRQPRFSGQYYLEFQMPKEIRKNINLSIERRNGFAALLGFKFGQYPHLNQEFSVKSPNIFLVTNLLNSHKYLNELENSIPHKGKIVVNGVSSIIIRKNIDLLMKTCKDIIRLIDLFNNYLEEINGIENYSEEELLAEVNQHASELTCIICFQSVVLNESQVLNCCGSVGHAQHLRDWFAKKTQCPYCRKANFKLISIPNQV